MKLSIVIVNFNVSHFLDQALLSLKKASKNIDLEIIVIDNNSADGSVDLVKSKFPHVILIENKVNTGFSKANNQGIKIAKGKYVLLLNPDTVVEEDTLEKCCDFMDQHPEAGGLGVMMVDGKGTFLPESKRGLPTPWVAFYKVFGFAALFPKSKKFGRYHLGFLDKNQIHEIDVLSGAYMFLRRQALDKVGLLDEDYFMYGEDIDLSYRILQGGYKNYYFPNTRIIHYKGESTKRTSLNYVFVFYKAMIIFAQKRFSKNGAAIFSFLINVAIYLRAGLSIVTRISKWLFFPLTDFLVLYIGFYFLKNYWEENYKSVNYYPPEYLHVVIPAYILVWIATLYLSGVYDKKVNSFQIVRGVAIGTLLISAASNFIDSYRFSKALIIIGSIWTIGAIIIIRLSYHFIRYRNLALGESPKKKIIVVGNPAESLRAVNLLRGSSFNFDILGYISPFYSSTADDLYLGKIEQMDQLIMIYQIDEIVFCSKDFSANQIIEWMMNINNQFLEYKILPDDSNYIIGSNSKNTSGDFYTLNLDLNIIHKSAVRNKKLIDLGISVLLLLFYPFVFWMVKKPLQFFKNILNVLKGKYTWVGFSNSITVTLPKIKKGVITPVTHISLNKLDQSTINKLNLLYAKNYNAFKDFDLILKSFKNLDHL